MATINDLLYNYQEGNEFVCSDGRMSVNGICQAAQQPDSVDASNITKEIIETSKDGNDNNIIDKFNTGWDSSMGPRKDMGYTENKKGKFEWDFDKDTKVDGYKNTINNNINAYNGWIEDNMGIPTNVQNAARIGSSGIALASGASLAGVLAPWAIPFFAGAAIKKAEKNRIQNITDQDTQGDINIIDLSNSNESSSTSKDRGRERGKGETGQISGGHHF